ncbi:MAG: hypothetical protein BWK78_04615 [Thiotrichaceae bacterium IS1]|nr:MAG: hypothetical protein BWK78_04615 [Thiotrichaceae bacterium IS1]
MTCFDKKSSTPTAAALSYPSVATTLSYPFVFASSLAKNITSLLGVGYSIMPQFGSIGLSLGLRKQSGPGLLKTQLPPSEEPFKFDENFFRTNPSTAVLYLFMYDQNPEYKDVDILLKYKGSPDGQRFQPVTRDLKLIEKEVENFRTAIENQEPLDKIHQIGGQLYNWLIGPVASTIGGGIDTLILVPNSTLHTLPFAALWNGQNGQYLIQKYALVVEPAGAQLTDFQTTPKYNNVSALLGGISKKVGNFNPLPNTITELNAVGRFFSNDKGELNGTKLINEDFTTSNLQESLRQYPLVVHLSTHGVFDATDKRSPYLVKYPDTDLILSINNLANIMASALTTSGDKKLVELLVLSACQSAIGGNGKDALGLAGTGVKAGARGAVGTLWPVNENTTQSLVTKFYEKFKNDNMTKAKALQEAQKFILSGSGEASQIKKFTHPYYWAAFLLTGNWL